jgi:hypothetical protein
MTIDGFAGYLANEPHAFLRGCLSFVLHPRHSPPKGRRFSELMREEAVYGV